jgi:hypothetical protein
LAERGNTATTTQLTIIWLLLMLLLLRWTQRVLAAIHKVLKVFYLNIIAVF